MSKFNVFAANDGCAAREYDEYEHEFRSKFERDRDRILYSKAFRRLSGKTQVFVAGKDDHTRTRLTHTLEVAQISTTISKYFGLNMALTEAIAYGHDIGHTPFGHVGERTLNYIMNGCYPIKDFNTSLSDCDKGFKHNWQGLRVVLDLEQLKRRFYGLNLTDYTRWGILNHSKIKYKECKRRKGEYSCNLLLFGNDCGNKKDEEFSLQYYEKYDDLFIPNVWSMEALIVEMADEIAQRHHDIEDGIEAHIIDKVELLMKFESFFSGYLNKDEKKLIEEIKEERDETFYVPMFSKLIVNFLTTKLIKDMEDNLERIVVKCNIESNDDFHQKKEEIQREIELDKIVSYDKEFKEIEKKFQKYLRNRILNSYTAQCMDGKADYIIRQLFKAYISNPQQLPDKTILTLYRNIFGTEEFENMEKKYSLPELTGILRGKLEKDHFTSADENYKSTMLRVVCDYIAGMTDKYAIGQYKSLYGSDSYN